MRHNRNTTGHWLVQVGREKSAYTTRYSFPATGEGHSQALFWYNGLNTHSGHKKRLVSPEGQIKARYLS